MYSYKKEEYEKVRLEIKLENGKPKYKMVEAKEDEKFIKKYEESSDKKAEGVKKKM